MPLSTLSATHCLKFFCYLLITMYIIFLFWSTTETESIINLDAVGGAPPPMISASQATTQHDTPLSASQSYGFFDDIPLKSWELLRDIYMQVDKIVHCYSVTTIHPFLTILIQDIEALTRGGVTIMSQILVVNSRRGSVATEMVPSGWVKLKLRMRLL